MQVFERVSCETLIYFFTVKHSSHISFTIFLFTMVDMGHILLLYTVVYVYHSVTSMKNYWLLKKKTRYSLGYDGSLLNGLQALPPWVRDFGAPAGYDLGLISASYYLPKIPMCFVFAWLTDKYGRKCTLWLGGALMFAGAIVGGTSASRGQLIGSRILIGMGTGSGCRSFFSFFPLFFFVFCFSSFLFLCLVLIFQTCFRYCCCLYGTRTCTVSYISIQLSSFWIFVLTTIYKIVLVFVTLQDHTS